MKIFDVLGHLVVGAFQAIDVLANAQNPLNRAGDLLKRLLHRQVLVEVLQEIGRLN